MPIYALTKDEVSQLCIECKVTHQVSLHTLEVSGVTEHGIAAAFVVMPACAICDSVETLFALSDSAPQHPRPGGFNHLHGLLVDQLHLALLAEGRVSADSKERTARVRRTSHEALAEWFPDGPTLTLPDELLGVATPSTEPTPTKGAEGKT
jgi:hypothetical protein